MLNIEKVSIIIATKHSKHNIMKINIALIADLQCTCAGNLSMIFVNIEKNIWPSANKYYMVGTKKETFCRIIH